MCSCTSCADSYLGRAFRPRTKRRSTRRSWRARSPPLWRCSAGAIRRSLRLTSTTVARCGSTTARITPTFAGCSRTSSCARASSRETSSTGRNLSTPRGPTAPGCSPRPKPPPGRRGRPPKTATAARRWRPRTPPRRRRSRGPGRRPRSTPTAHPSAARCMAMRRARCQAPRRCRRRRHSPGWTGRPQPTTRPATTDTTLRAASVSSRCTRSSGGVSWAASSAASRAAPRSEPSRAALEALALPQSRTCRRPGSALPAPD
mmetsp:Transcript_164028/g.398648  ORF Transcript_164028/g.398648 Transcript_164028/m.398648 type:complete len:260 (+) Transcript_164028:779-1558(+)